MSLVLPRKKGTDFLAPSKTLEEARKKLGDIYFDSNLIECPQNAVELTKLLQQWDDLDKQKYKIIEETRRKQRILLHSLNSQYTVSESNTAVDTQPEIIDVKLPPAGFRYHNNGEPKLQHFNSTSHLIGRPSNRSMFSLGGFSSIQDIRSIGRSSRNLQSMANVNVHHSDSNENPVAKTEASDIDYKEEIKQLESLIDELTAELANRRLTEYYEKTIEKKSHALSFLRAHSRDEIQLKRDEQRRRYIHPEEGFAFQPSVVASEKNITKRGRESTAHSACIACQFKLKHNKDDYEQLKKIMTKPCLRKWRTAPSGTFIESKMSLNRMTSSHDRMHALSSVSGVKKHISVPLYNHLKDTRQGVTQSSYHVKSHAREQQLIDLKRGVKSAPLLTNGLSFIQQHERKPSMEVLREIAASEETMCVKKVKAFLQRMDSIQKQERSQSQVL